MTDATASTYDELPYEHLAYYHTHPSNLAVVATLCGLDPPPLDGCRVLELGCGAGFNLLAMAESLPNSRFVGVDLAERQIADGRAVAAAIGTDRVELLARDISGIGGSLGPFDYVVAHGVLSWVPPDVGEALLATCRQSLAPGGIAYVSYNTYPGWHLRTIIRDVLLFHAPPSAPPLERVRAARSALERMLGDLPEPESNYGRLLRSEVEGLRADADEYVFHEFLETDNRPLRFEEFARAAAAHGLRFFSEARFGTSPDTQPEAVQRALAAVSDDPVRREQYLDHLMNRSFRQSLLRRAESAPPRAPSLEAVGRLRILCRVELLDDLDGERDGRERFRLDGERVIQTGDAPLRAILHALRRAGPRPLPVAELAAAASRLIDAGIPPSGRAAERFFLPRVVRGYADGLWQLFAHEPPTAQEPPERPLAPALARHAAGRGPKVTNLLHGPVVLAEEDRAVLRRLDGLTTRSGLAASLSLGPEAVERSLGRLVEAALIAR